MKFFVEIGCLSTYDVEYISGKIKKFRILRPGGVCLLQLVKKWLAS